MALMPQPLSWGERMELAQRLRREAAEKIAEAERIEKGLEDDQNAVWEAVQKMRAKQVPNAEFRPTHAASSREVAPGTPGYAGDNNGEA